MQTPAHKQFMAAAAKKRARIVRLRDVDNKTFDEIGVAVGITRQRAAQIYSKEKKRASK